MQIKSREKLYIYLYSFKPFNQLKQYGLIHYFSRKMNYVVMYVDSDKKTQVLEELEALSFVREVTISPHKEVDKSFEHSLDNWLRTLPDKNSKDSEFLEPLI